MKKLVFAALLMFVGTISYSQYDPKALEILEAMSKKYKAISAFEANLTSGMTNETEGVKEEFKGKITVKGDKFRLLLDDQEIINNGTTVWTYLPSAKEVNIDNFDPGSDDVNPTKIFEMYKKGFKYLYLADKTDGGVVCEEIDLVPEKKDAQYFKIKMMIVKKDKSIQSWTMFDKAGNRYKYTITKFVPNVKVDDAFFTFDPKKYPGVEIIDLR
ncbi:MAG TPA: outer membrane lipoprotein carrier protein LolA [Cyclobacteriaceae bacterium]|jgi:outer membrane lipoprotein-sorting protein|nr:outer membrane lipoprotein carrier protein LolA [Cyclobacteriaceae bacterium]HPW62242.1 outer membrane lipoprotein carrier protein LolA [Cyclobacteriaceae bacterium]HRG78720.1 outer membrane lipoprotein carrier protein LolA [Cyclobacteriaceae bacterium]